MQVSETNFELADRVCVVTGGAGILGEPMCAALARYGGKVAVMDNQGERIAAVVKRIAEANSLARIIGVTADIRSREEVEKAVSSIENTLGPIDVLVNNAAAKSPNFFAPFESFPLDDWNHVMSINLTGAMICCQVVGAAMAQRGRGSIVNTLSIYGIVGPDQRIYEGSSYEGRAINTPAIYSASKAGLWGLTKYLATYWGGRGVRVNAITPGGVFSGQNDIFVDRYSARVPLGRMAQKNELCGALVFLASDASSYVTGQNLVVDGGLTAW
jgi:NAD(P)-dependent dehydrogenase (short-subunit alcohol dehydrogenase family)